jgi:tRNA pseudouridine13 synthase
LALIIYRYSDFLVNEILPSGEVLHLQSLQVPKLMRSRKNAHAEIIVAQGTQTQADAVEQKEKDTTEGLGKGDPSQEHAELQDSKDAPEEGSSKSKFDVSTSQCYLETH